MVFEAYERVDGLWDLEGHLADIKTYDVPLLDGVRPAGSPMHEMWIRVTVDNKQNIIEACGAMDAVPHWGSCETIAPDYAGLVGLNLMHGFRAAVRERFGNTHRCTHVNELINHLPTVAVQAMWSRISAKEGRKPLPIDQCHAQTSDSEVVRRLYPQWYRAPRESEHPSEEST